MTTTTLETIAERATAQALALAPDGTRGATVHDDEYEQWHIELGDIGEAQLPAKAIYAYRFAVEVWERCQGIVEGAVEDIIADFPDEARDNGWPTEWLRGDITRAHLDARIAGCKHPIDETRTIGTTGSRRCEACATWLPRLETAKE